MLPKENRLKKKQDFEKVFKKGKGFKEGFLFFKIAPNGLAVSRFGLVVSQKISKKATLRNQVKRRLKQVIACKIPEIKRGFDIVIVALRGLEAQKSPETETTIEQFLKKTKLI